MTVPSGKHIVLVPMQMWGTSFLKVPVVVFYSSKQSSDSRAYSYVMYVGRPHGQAP